MAKFRVLLVAGLTGLLAVCFSAQAASATPAPTGDTFACAAGFYQVVSPGGGAAAGQFKILDAAAQTYSTIGTPTGYKYNAIGFNTDDNYVYGVVNDTSNAAFGHVLRIDSLGVVQDLGMAVTPGNPAVSAFNDPSDSNAPHNIYGGGYDAATHRLIVNEFGHAGGMWSIDLSTLVATPIPNAAGVNVADFVVIDGVGYGIYKDTSELVRIDLNPSSPTYGTHTESANIPNMPSSVYGAAFAAYGSRIFFADNNSGIIYEVTDYVDPNATPVAIQFVQATLTPSNDGASCPGAALPGDQVYQLSYDIAGGTGVTPSTVTALPLGQLVSVDSATTFSRPGYEFDHWSCDNTIGDLSAGANYSQPAANVVCTAIWSIDSASGSASGAAGSPSQLASTGVEPAWIIVLASNLLLIGAAFMARRRRPS